MTDAVNQIQTTSTMPGTNTAKATNLVDYDTFLQLLVAQMKNQDPTSPMDSTDYVAQLATFSQVEQSVQIKNKLEDLLQANALAQASGFIGKEIEAMDGSISGIVKEVQVYSDGVIAVLTNGQKVAMSAGVIIRDPAAA